MNRLDTFGGPSAALGVLPIVLLSVLVTATSTLESGELPCILQHGCVCNHSLPHQYDKDGQYYGTCSACDQGWGGPFCSHRDVPCLNGGFRDTDSQCVCTEMFTGPRCAKRMCANSIGGSGANHVAAPSANNFCEKCRPGNSGLGCELCSADAACPSGTICNTSLVASGDNKNIECRLPAGNPLLKVLGSGRKGVGGVATLNCSKPGGFGTTGNDGTCQLGFYREEPDKKYIDAFFFCSLFECSMKVTRKLEDDGKQRGETGHKWLRVFRIVMTSVLLVLCASIALVSFARTPERRKRFTLILGSLLLVCLFAFVLTMITTLNHRPQSVAEVVEYTCNSASCACGNDPVGGYEPMCNHSALFKAILQKVEKVNLQCRVDTGECVLPILTTRVDLTCKASECVKPDSYHAASVGDAATRAKSTTGITMVLVAFTTIIVILLCKRRSDTNSRAAKAEFCERFLNGPSGGAGENGEADGEHVPSNASMDFDDFDESVGSGTMRTSTTTTSRTTTKRRKANSDNSGWSATSPFAGGERYTGLNAEPDSDEMLPSGDDEDERSSMLDSPPPSGREGTSLRSPPPAPSPQHRANTDSMDSSIMSPLSRDNRSLMQHFNLQINGLGYAVEGPDGDAKPILRNVNFTVGCGDVVALMGPSGAGKTTLLDILAGRSKTGTVTGRVVLGGCPLDSTDRKTQYRALVGYVAQEDTLIPSLTVRQAILYAARLKLPAAFSHKTIRDITDSVIRSLHLQRCADTVIGDNAAIRGVSGGERRRVSIAVELVANPRIIFLDEPTSGLDAASARHVMEAIAHVATDPPMRKYAPEFFGFKPIVFFSIHQPSAQVFATFDKVLLLSQGSPLYFGNANSAVAHISAVGGIAGNAIDPAVAANPADALLAAEEVLDQQGTTALYADAARAAVEVAQGIVEQPERGARILEAATHYRRFYPNAWQQLRILCLRTKWTLLGRFYLVACHAVVTAALAALFNLLYPSEALDLPGALNRAGSTTFLLLVVSLLSLSCLEMLLSERKLFVVERENMFYGSLPYYVAKLLFDIIPLRIIPLSVLASTIYFSMGMRTDSGGPFLWFMLIIAMFSTCVTLMVMCVSMVSPSFGASALLAAVLILWHFVFGGMMVQADTMPAWLRPVRLTSPFFLSFESLLVNELDGQMCTFAPTDATGKPASSQVPLLCVQYLFNMGLYPDAFDRDVLLLGLWCVFWFLLGWFLLSRMAIKR